MRIFEFMGQHQVKIEDLRKHCDLRHVWAIQQGDPVDREDALQVVRELNKLAGTSRELRHFNVHLCAEELKDPLASLKGARCYKHRF